MKEKYGALEKGIINDLMDLSLRHGPVEIQLTEETEDTGDFAPAIIIKTAPDGVLRGLAEDDRIADMAMEYGELHITPAPAGLAGAFMEPDGKIFPGFGGHWGDLPAPYVTTNKDLDSWTWEAIDEVARSGKAPLVLGLGAFKHFTLKNGETVKARIIDFNHDPLADDPGQAPTTWELVATMAEERPMNKERTNATSWEGSDLRAWLNNDLWELLPDDLKAIIKPVLKLTASTEKKDQLIETRDKLFIKSEREMTGRCFYSAPGEGRQYALYAAEGVSWAMRNPTGGDAWPWLRSPYASYATRFCHVSSDGAPNYNIAGRTYGVAFGFCV